MIVKLDYELHDVIIGIPYETTEKPVKVSAKDRVEEIINTIGNSLDTPYYASKILSECGKEILNLVAKLEKENELLRKKISNGEFNYENF